MDSDAAINKKGDSKTSWESNQEDSFNECTTEYVCFPPDIDDVDIEDQSNMSEGCSPEVGVSMNQEEQVPKSDEKGDGRSQEEDKNLASSPARDGEEDDENDVVKDKTSFVLQTHSLPSGEALQQHHQEKASFHGDASRLAGETVPVEKIHQSLASSKTQKESNSVNNTPLQALKFSLANSAGNEGPKGPLSFPSQNRSVPVSSSASLGVHGGDGKTRVPGFAARKKLTGCQVSTSSSSPGAADGIKNFQVVSAGSLRIVLPTTQHVQLTAAGPNKYLLTLPSAVDKSRLVVTSQKTPLYYIAQPGSVVQNSSAPKRSAVRKRNHEASVVSPSDKESGCQTVDPPAQGNGAKVMKITQQGNPTQSSLQSQPVYNLVVMNNRSQNSAARLNGQASTKPDKPSAKKVVNKTTKFVKIAPQASSNTSPSVFGPSVATAGSRVTTSRHLVTATGTMDDKTQQYDGFSSEEDVVTIEPISKVADSTENLRSESNMPSGVDSLDGKEIYDGPIVIRYTYVKDKPIELKKQTNYKPKGRVAAVKKKVKGRSKGTMTDMAELNKWTSQLPIVPVKQNKSHKKKSSTDGKESKPIERPYRIYDLREVQRSEGFTEGPLEKTESFKGTVAWRDMTKNYECKLCPYTTVSPRSICHHLIESHREFIPHLYKALSSEKVPSSQAVLLDFVLGKDLSTAAIDDTDEEENSGTREKLLEENKSDSVRSGTSVNESGKLSSESSVSDFATNEATSSSQGGVQTNQRQVDDTSYSQLSSQGTVQNANDVVPDANSEEMRSDSSEGSSSSDEQHGNEAPLDVTSNHKQVGSTSGNLIANGKQPDCVLKINSTNGKPESIVSDTETSSQKQSFEVKIPNQKQAGGTSDTTETNQNAEAANQKQSDSTCDINTSNQKQVQGTCDAQSINQKQSNNTSGDLKANQQQVGSASNTSGPNKVLAGEPQKSPEEIRYLETDTVIPFIRKYATIVIQCPKCNLKLRMFKLSDRHHCYRTNRDVLCEECGKVTSLTCYRRHYQLVHRGGKKVKCEICQREILETSLKQHNRKCHSGENRKVACSMCGKTLASYHQLRKHEAIHRSEMPYKCSICNRGFTQRTNMMNHMRQHTGEQPYKCDHCTKCFTHKVSLKTHLKKYHGIDLWKQGHTGGGRPKKTK